MLYVTCPTCGTFLGNKTIQFEEEKKKICNNPSYNDEKKSEMIAFRNQSIVGLLLLVIFGLLVF